MGSPKETQSRMIEDVTSGTMSTEEYNEEMNAVEDKKWAFTEKVEETE